MTCVRYEYDCYYAPGSDRGSSYIPKPGPIYTPTSSSAVGPPSGSTPTPSPEIATQPLNRAPSHQGIPDPYRSCFVNASSAVAFPRILGIELNSRSVPRLHSYAWNLGIRPPPHIDQLDFTHYLPFTESQRLVDVYFNVVHPVFAFLDRQNFNELWRARYLKRCKHCDIDPIICGVAALGSLFAIGAQQASHPHEADLTDLAKACLENTSTLGGPTQDHVTAWMLRTNYLRATSRPHGAWLSSCTTMHIIEATGLHHEISNTAIPSPAALELSPVEIEARRRLFWVAWALNTTISYEYGRGRVSLPNASVRPIDASEPGIHTHQLISIAQILPSECAIANNTTDDVMTLYSSFRSLTGLHTQSDELSLYRADLAFCLYRRLRLFQSSCTSIPSETTSLVISIGLSALPSVERLAARHLPWWTVISVPFRLLCVLLAIDSRESLSRVAQVIITLEEVGRQWDTHMVREAVGCAGVLVKLSRRKKEKDLKWLDDGMPHGPIAGEGEAGIGLHDTSTDGIVQQSPQQFQRWNSQNTQPQQQQGALTDCGPTLNAAEGLDVPLLED